MKNQHFALLDIGGTDIKSGVFSLDTRKVNSLKRSRTPSFVDSKYEKREILPKDLLQVVNSHLNGIKASYRSVDGLLITGQMGGWVITDGSNKPISNLVSWQDCRSIANERRSALNSEEIHFNGGESRIGLPIRGLLTDYQNKVFNDDLRFHSILSFVTSSFASNYQYLTHVTDIASSGTYNIYSNEYISSLNNRFDNQLKFPSVTELVSEVGYSTHLNCRVFTPIGDQQASLHGAQLDKDKVVVNIGTGGQVSKIYNGDSSINQIRPYFHGSKIETITHLPAGRLIDHIVSVFLDRSSIDEKFSMFYNSEPKVCESNNIDLGNFEQCLNYFTKRNFPIESDLFSKASYLIIQHYIKIIERLSINTLKEIVFVGGVGKKYVNLHRSISDRFDFKCSISDLDESTLYGLGYLSLSLE